MQFELPATRTLEFTGSRTVPVLYCGAGVYKTKTEDQKTKNEDPNFFARIRHGQLKN